MADPETDAELAAELAALKPVVLGATSPPTPPSIPLSPLPAADSPVSLAAPSEAADAPAVPRDSVATPSSAIPAARTDDESQPFVAASPLHELLASKKNLAIAAGALVTLVVVLVFAFGGSDATTRSAAAPSEERSAAADPAVTGEPATGEAAETEVPPEATRDITTEAAGDEGSAANADGDGNELRADEDSAASDDSDGNELHTDEASAASEEGNGDERHADKDSVGKSTPSTSTKTRAARSEAARTARPAGNHLGGKQVVLEYDSQTRNTADVPGAPDEDQSAIRKARVAYAAGNQRLLAGDNDGAIRNYRQSLAYYPGYVAGYRGLGLAYDRQGNTAKALQAFRTYLRHAPRAKDAPRIRTRMAELQRR